VACVIGVASENCACAVELFGDDEAGECVGERESSEGEQEPGAGACGFGPAIGRADGEDDMLRAFIAASAEPGGECLGGELAAAAVEQDGDGRGASLLTVEPLEKRGFSFEGCGSGPGEDGAAIEVDRGERIKPILRTGARADVRKGELHGERITVRAAGEWLRRCSFLDVGGVVLWNCVWILTVRFCALQ
jgi:hypothetical protein